MCGRFSLHAEFERLVDYLGRELPDVYARRYNIAPTTPVLALTGSDLTFFSWGLVPGWAKDVNIGNKMFNARSETVAEKPSFRNAFKRRRCLIPASGFYEWRAEAGGKQPYFCHLDQPIFCFAGIWEHWSDAMGNELQSCAILTQESRGAMHDLHHRMPVVIDESMREMWLDHRDEDTSRALSCIESATDRFRYYPVSRQVNSARNDSAALVELLERPVAD